MGQKSSLSIGKLKLSSPFMTAPMAGLTDLAWRLLVRSFAEILTFSEMISVEGLKRNHKKTLSYLDNRKKAEPFGVQLFGAEPESFKEAIEVIKDYPFDLIDINMGCPVKKVTKRGAGSALMKTPDIAVKIIESIREVYHGPLTAKIRAGWDSNHINAIEMAISLEKAGLDAIIVHPRTQKEFFRGHSDWEIIKKVKESVKIPVIGNGDVIDIDSAKSMIEETGCNGIMIGRAALSSPWIFKELCRLSALSLQANTPSLRAIAKQSPGSIKKDCLVPARNDGHFHNPLLINTIKKHIKLLLKYNSEKYAIIMMKQFIPKYFKGIKGAKELNQKVFRAQSIDEVLGVISCYK